MSMTEEEHEMLLDHIFAVTRRECLIYRCLPTEIWGGKRASKTVGMAPLRNVSQARLAVALVMRRTIGSEKQGGPLVVRTEGIPVGWAPISLPHMGKFLGCTHGAIVHAFSRRRELLAQLQVNSQAEATA